MSHKKPLTLYSFATIYNFAGNLKDILLVLYKKFLIYFKTLKSVSIFWRQSCDLVIVKT